MILVSALICFILLIVASVLSLAFGVFYKKTRKNVKNGIHFIYHLVPRSLEMPSFTDSPYFNRYPDKASKWTVDLWSMCPTIDDPWLKELAKEVEEQCKGKSDKYKAGYILKIAQCIYTYEKDQKIYGQADRWQFPVCTAYLRTGDCEDGSFIGAGLSHLCGLDTVVIYEEGHALYGVNVKGFGFKVKYGNKSYLKCETTSILPIGMVLSNKTVKGIYEVKAPRDKFIEDLTFIDQFDKYKD